MEGIPVIDYADMTITCPICDVEHHLLDFYQHLLDEHPEMYLTMISMTMPNTPAEDVLAQMMHQLQHPIDYEFEMFEYEEDDNTYENLLDLCDTIGYHYIGVPSERLDQVTTKGGAGVVERCPICLEQPSGSTRRLNTCGHAYCSECIEVWFQQHKTCPVCKNDVLDVCSNVSIEDNSEPQMASISIPSSSSTLAPLGDVSFESAPSLSNVELSSSMNTT
jgi:hypothetical protein